MTIQIESVKRCVDATAAAVNQGIWAVTYVRIGAAEGNRNLGRAAIFRKSNLWVRLVLTVAY